MCKNSGKSGLKNKQPDGYDPKMAQHPFSFFRGTVLHEYLNPNSEKCINKKLAKKIILWDVSLRETKFGKWILDKLGVKEVAKISTNIESLLHTKDFPYYVQAKIYKSRNLFGDLTARALSRTSLIGTGALGGLGVIHTAYKVKQGGDIIEETAKTALQIGTTLIGVGYLGAIGYKHLGTLGSLVGIGAGTALGEATTGLFHSGKSSSKTL